jgi:hypothetical protein
VVTQIQLDVYVSCHLNILLVARTNKMLTIPSRSPLKPNKQSRRLTLDTSFCSSRTCCHWRQISLELWVKQENILNATRFSSSFFKNTLDNSLTTTTAVTNDEGSVCEMWANFAKENQMERVHTTSGNGQKVMLLIGRPGFCKKFLM